MLKKKNMAIVMAAATVATSVAPVFASTIETVTVDEAQMIAKVEELLNKKYTDSTISGGEGYVYPGQEHKNSVYKIEKADNTRIDSIETLKAEIEKAKVAGVDLTLQVTDKGHREDENGNIVDSELTKNTSYNQGEIEDITTLYTTELGSNIFGTIVVANGTATTPATITLTNGEIIELIEGDYKLDLSKPVDANGNLIDPETTDAATIRKIVGFKLAENSTATMLDIPNKRVQDLVITSNRVIEKDLSELKTEDGYTQEGADLVNLVVAAGQGTTEVVKDGVRYDVNELGTAGEVDDVVATKDGYELKIELEVRKDGVAFEDVANVTIVIKSDSQNKLVELKEVLEDTNEVEAGNVTVLAGDDRFETAIAVSQEAYVGKNETGANKAGAIVLVGENAIVDGLSAAPLAAQEEAPILLTKKDEVPASTMAEIKRLVEKGTEIYLIGGENTISKEVEAQLIKEMNANLIRLEGKDRYETSLAIAGEITSDGNAFVVGGTGLADAMSIASVAAQDGNIAPIIVTPKDGLTKDAKRYLEDNAADIDDVYAVGGEAHISTQVLKDIKVIESSVERIAGTDRNDTNAKVIKEFFSPDLLENVYISKDGDTQLIDALAAAPLAGKNSGAIVLATNDLTNSQIKEIKTAKKTSGTPEITLTQVGGGIASTVVSKLVELLGL